MSGKYDAGRDALGSAEISWTAHAIMAQLVAETYAFDPAHGAPADIIGLVGKPVELAGKSLERGWARANNIIFRQVTGARVGAIVLWRENAGGQTLIAHIDGIHRFPMTPNGGDIRIDVPAQGLFRI